MAQRKVDLNSLTPDEQRIFKLYGKLPTRSDLLHSKLNERKYFDSGDYAVSKAVAAAKSDLQQQKQQGDEFMQPTKVSEPAIAGPVLSSPSSSSSSVSSLSTLGSVSMSPTGIASSPRSPNRGSFSFTSGSGVPSQSPNGSGSDIPSRLANTHPIDVPKVGTIHPDPEKIGKLQMNSVMGSDTNNLRLASPKPGIQRRSSSPVRESGLREGTR
ncbi:hypothetical protein NADFUDRAFT_52075 [Nadsonia fulvescens var. elongata DSM 6958]|uniref:mRNA stability protein n=1 Tax=Nadsonia fulvescens var. elongata DSM 6958 TaxID=857566 RepID=A0A1E3PKX3_9ASCO|nr:hypothetical protein NADFUDRAFT_52075 [Nadsonia fulvescens var. elongata DSM 6958]